MTLKTIWQDWIGAVQFLTILPCGSSCKPFNAGRSMAYFPLCGLLLGIAVIAADTLANRLWMPASTSLLIVLILAGLSGGLHLDGVADTADGLYGRREPEKALAIMKDSRIGAIGAIAVVCCLAIKWAGIYGIHADRSLWLMLVPAYARTGVLFAIRRLPYGRPVGIGRSFYDEPVRWRDFWALPLLVGLSLLSGPKMVLINLGFAAIVAASLMYYRRKIGCITGDMLGALIEFTEAGLFFLLSAGDMTG